MALLPLLLDEVEDLAAPPAKRYLNLDVCPYGLLPRPSIARALLLDNSNAGYRRRRKLGKSLRSADSGNGELVKNPNTIGKDGFQVCLDVHQFAPNEINVKTVGNNTIVVDANHEEREDEHGYISRKFTRRYTLPKGFNIKDVVSTLSSDGVLSIKAPPVEKATKEGNVRHIQIQQTGPAHLTIGNKENAEDKKEANGNQEKMVE